MLTNYTRSFFDYAGRRAWISLGLAVFLGGTQGVGLVMILPFLHIIGMAGPDGGGGYAPWVIAGMQKIGVPATFFPVLGVYFLIIVLHAVVVRFRTLLNVELVEGYTQHLRNELYGKFCRADWLCFLKTPDADIIHVLTNDLERVGFAVQRAFHLIGAVILVAIHLVVSLMISVPMTLSAMGCGLVFLLFTRPFNRQAARFGMSFHDAMGDLYKAVTEHAGGMKVAKSYHLEAACRANFQSVTDRITAQAVNFTRINSATRLSYQIGAASAICVLLTVGVRVLRMPGADLVVILFLFARILPGFSGLQQYFQEIVNAVPSLRAVQEMGDRFQAAREPLPPEHASPLRLDREIRFHDVSFRYDKHDDEYTLADVNLVIPANSTTAVTGPSGAGKSTFADLLLGLMVPDRGRITIDGQPLNDGLLHRWRVSVGYVPQDTFLFHESVRDNLVRACPGAADAEIEDALVLAAADTFVSRLPDGIHTVVGDRGVRLSGGERQRIALARALLRKPALLLLDEATSSLDDDHEKQIQKALRQLRGKLTIVVIAHRSSTMDGADRILTLTRKDRERT